MEQAFYSSDTKQRILEAALNCFSENGFHASTTRIIAQRADVNEVTLFRHFKTKMELFKEILNHVRSVGFNSERLENLNLGPIESVRYVIEAIIETLEQHPREYRIMHHAVLDEVEGFEEEYVHESQSKMIDFLEKAFAALKKERLVDPDFSPKTLSILLHSMLMGVASGRVLMQNFPIKALSIKTIADTILQLFIKKRVAT